MPRWFAAILLWAPLGCATPPSAPAPDHAFVFLRPVAEMQLSEERAAELGRGHMANIRRLAAEGVLLFAGPTGDGGGVFILQSATMADADRILATDPAVAAGAFAPDTFLGLVTNGRLCTAPEPIRMMRRDLIGGHWPSPQARADFLRAAGLVDADLLLTAPSAGRFVIVFDGPAQTQRRERIQAAANDAGVPLQDVAEVFSAVGVLCDQ